MAPQDDVGKLAHYLRNAPNRGDFQGANWKQKLIDATITEANIPKALIDALRGLSGTELAAVMKANSELDANGMTGDSRLTQFPV